DARREADVHADARLADRRAPRPVAGRDRDHGHPASRGTRGARARTAVAVPAAVRGELRRRLAARGRRLESVALQAGEVSRPWQTLNPCWVTHSQPRPPPPTT